jgi:hypothetical protein
MQKGPLGVHLVSGSTIPAVCGWIGTRLGSGHEMGVLLMSRNRQWMEVMRKEPPEIEVGCR